MNQKDSSGNSSDRWDEFDTGAYLAENRFDWGVGAGARPPLQCDRWAFATLLAEHRSVAALAPAGTRLEIVTIGTGPNLSEPIAALPSGRVRIIERSKANRAYQQDRQRHGLGPRGNDAGWLGWIQYATELGVTIDPRLFAQVEISDGDVFNLPAGIADVITMCSCLESATDNMAQFDQGCESIANAIREGGSMFAFFMGNPDDYYPVGQQRFPALPVDQALLTQRFGPWFRSLEVQEVPGATDIRPDNTMWHVQARGRLG